MKIVITGSTGFLGKHLAERLKKDKIPFRVFDRERHNFFGISTLESLLKDCDVVVHLAGISRSKSNKEILRVNKEGAESLLNAICRFSPQAKIIFASSFQIYHPSNIYGKSKKEAEEAIEKTVKNSSIKAIILRFSNIYGAGGKPHHNSVISTFIHQIRHNKQLRVDGKGGQKRDFLYVDDAVGAIVKTIYFKGKDIEYFDICTGKLTSLRSVINMLRKYSAGPFEVKFVASETIEHHYRIRKNYAKAKKMLEWTPQVSIEEGLKKTVKLYGKTKI